MYHFTVANLGLQPYILFNFDCNKCTTLIFIEKITYIEIAYSGSSNSVPENIPQVPLRIHAVPESTSSVITSSCLGFTVR